MIAVETNLVASAVSSACADKTLHEATPMRIGGFMWEGWNETWVMDPKTKKYCNATPTTTIQPSQTPGNGSIPSGPGSGTGGVGAGYYRNVVSPPEGVTAAKGTTLNCGKWHIVESGPDCGDICLAEGIPYNLFMAVNPSLSMDDCPGSLIPATALCVGPTPEWDQPPLLNTTSVPTGTGTKSSTLSSVVSLMGTSGPSQTTISSSGSSTKNAVVSNASATS